MMPKEIDDASPVSIDLGNLNEKESLASVDLGGDEGVSAPISIDLGATDESIQPSTFTGSITTDVGVIQVDPSLMPPEKEGMKKGQFFLGLFAPIALSILMSIVVMVSEEAMYDDWENEFTITKNSDGTFTFNPSESDVNCQDGDYDFSFYWQNGSGEGHSWSDCYSDITTTVAYQSGRWHPDGTLDLYLPYAPTDGFDVRVFWWDGGDSDRSASMGIGDGENKNFSKDLGNRNQYCDIWGDVEVDTLNEGSNPTYANIGCSREEGNYTVFLYMDEVLAKNSGEWGVPVDFTLPAGNEDVEQITVEYWDYGGGDMAFVELLPMFCCLGFIGLVVAAFMMGYKWFAYGALSSMVVAPAIFVIACFGMLIAYGL